MTRAHLALPLVVLLEACTCGNRCKAGCLGCCNESGLCESGKLDSACGASGVACVACAEGVRCLFGVCPTYFDGGVLPCGPQSCDPTTSDLCLGAVCSCGGGFACTPGAVCEHGTCRCDATTCNGCCQSGGACVPLGQQPISDCGSNGAACQDCQDAGSDHCTSDGECRCGAGSSCAQDLQCLGGHCGCGCDGCCANGTCTPASMVGLHACGLPDQPCTVCSDITANLCVGGACACGGGPVCPNGLHCTGGACVCDALSCPGGCCQGTTCVPAAAQTTSQCGPIGGACIACPADAGCLAIGCDCATRLSCGAQAVAAGADHACGVTTYGDLRCWGNALDGGADVLQPQTVWSGASFLADVASGSRFTCAEGPFSTDCVGALSGVFPRLKGLSAGAHHVCGIATGGQALCWGDNTYGELGVLGLDGGVTLGGTAVAPTKVAGLDPGVDVIAAGATHTCALEHGLVFCWGRFDSSGDTPYDSALPLAVPLDAGMVALASGDGISCAAGPGTVYCWGRTSSTVQLDAVALGVGSGFACGLTGGGVVQCWGSNASGQLGNPDGGAVERGGPFSQLSVGSDFACAVGANRQISCWGDGLHGQLGSGMNASSAVPVPVAD